MAVKIRLRRMGKKGQPIYKVVAADERSPRDGKFIEIIGMYNPITNPATIDIKEERALYWLGVGALPTPTVKGLLSKQGILYKQDLLNSGLKEEEVAAKLGEWLKNKEAKLASKTAKKVVAKAALDEKKIEEKVSDSEGTVSEELQEKAE